jgi:hypothetical protein
VLSALARKVASIEITGPTRRRYNNTLSRIGQPAGKRACLIWTGTFKRSGTARAGDPDISEAAVPWAR